ncbi:CWF19-like protein 2 [Hyalella azteca]|uniref:CWF19-like protein 2 n=1 Tax=Hyalella azteca TaxID=294128 RepID=A0A979FMI4_HYAAZ|nr:CWF19-like protein 2 [Hyalella azteca]
MLPAVEKSLLSQNEKLSKKKKSKKEKKYKKAKKQKKYEKRSSSSSDSSSETEWVEKPAAPAAPTTSAPPTLQTAAGREDWMQMPSLFGTFTRDELRQREGSRALARQQEKNKPPDKPGSHALELNPYFREGGSGLPQDAPSGGEDGTLGRRAPKLGFGASVAWLKKAFQRATEEAREAGLSIEEVAEKRWGSLANVPRHMQRPAEADDFVARRGGKDRRHADTRRRSRSPDVSPATRRSPVTRGSPTSISRSPERRYGKSRRGERSPRRRRSSSSSSSSSEDHRRSRRRDQKLQTSSSDDERRERRGQSERRGRDEASLSSRSNDRRLLKPGEGRSDEGRDVRGSDRAVWEPARLLPSSAAPPGGGWRKRPRHPDTCGGGGQPHILQSEEPRSDEKSHARDTASPAPVKDSSHSVPDPAPNPADPDPANPNPDHDPKPKRVYTDHELNQIGAKIVKAELLGNLALAEKLKKKLERAKQETLEALAAGGGGGGTSGGTTLETVLLTTTNARGFTRPVSSVEQDSSPGKTKSRKKTKVSGTGVDGSRDKYFPDDHKFSLQQMFEKEKQGTTEDSDAMFVRAAGRAQKASLDDDYTLDDSFVDTSACGRTGPGRIPRMRAIMEHQRREKALASCSLCCDGANMKKHLLVSLGSKSYVSLPAHESLVDGHCLIVPRDHVSTSTLLDEDVWLEMMEYRKSLVRYFSSVQQDVVFLECCMRLRAQPHTAVHCIPLPRDLGDLAPIYFKEYRKSLVRYFSSVQQDVVFLECCMRLRAQPHTAVHCIPLPRDLGDLAPIYFKLVHIHSFIVCMQSVVGGMLDVEARLWRKPKLETFDQQRRKVIAFAKHYEQYDPVQDK